MTGRPGTAWAYGILVAAPLPLAVLCLGVGSSAIPWAHLPGLVAEGLRATVDPAAPLSPAAAVVWDIRLPRVLLALAVGSALAGAGAGCQAAFRNPLVEPFILGISGGAALGSALAIAFAPWLPVPVAAFALGLGAALLAYGLARTRGEVPPLTLVLSGVVVSALATSLLSLVKFTVDPHRLQAIVHWLMGSLSLAGWPALATAVPGIAVGLGVLWALRWRLNVLSLGDEEARALGVNAGRLRLLVLAASSLAAASAVSVSGIIGWVGLMVPHLARLLVGPEHRRLVPAAVCLGGAFLLAADTVARGLFPFEIPVGVVTTLSGAPFFVVLLKGRKSPWTS